MYKSNPYGLMADTESVIVVHDGRVLTRRLTSNEAFAWILNHQGQSVAYALEHGGYKVMACPADRWDDLEASALRRQAQALFTRHDHDGHWDQMTRENCSACCLGGYRPRGADAEWPKDCPNWAGWGRAYVQAGYPIKRRWIEAFRAQANEDTPYGEGLRMDIESFGWPAVA